MRGFSVINGAQTIATSARFAAENKDRDISAARVLITLIKAPLDGDFGSARDEVSEPPKSGPPGEFSALDDAQERLRREMANLGIDYAIKLEAQDTLADTTRIRIRRSGSSTRIASTRSAICSLAQKGTCATLDTNAPPYKLLFNKKLTAVQLLNAVRFLRYVQGRMVSEALAATGLARLTCKHGNFVQGWVLAKRLLRSINGGLLLDPVKMPVALSQPFDDLRQTLLTEHPSRDSWEGCLSTIQKSDGHCAAVTEINDRIFRSCCRPCGRTQKKPAETGTALS